MRFFVLNTTPKKFVLSKLSLGRLEGVNPALVKVVKRAIEITQQDFLVVEGVRSKEQCYINYGKGRTAAQCIAKGVPASYAQPKLAKVTWLNNPLPVSMSQAKLLIWFHTQWTGMIYLNLIKLQKRCLQQPKNWVCRSAGVQTGTMMAITAKKVNMIRLILNFKEDFECLLKFKINLPN
jgi:hypothetical protein